MIVWRIENEQGQGPYHGVPSLYRAFNCEANSMHPSPGTDGIKNYRDDEHVCGFISIGKMHDWFDRDYKKWLRKNEYLLAQYKAKPYNVKIGRKQCVFDKVRATLIERQRIPNEMKD